MVFNPWSWVVPSSFSDEIQISAKLPNSWDSVYVRQHIHIIYIYTRMYAPHIYKYQDINIHTYHICAYIKDTDIYIQYVDPLTSGFPYPLACDMSHQGLAWGECLHGLLEWLRRFGSDCLEEWVPKMEESWHNPVSMAAKKKGEDDDSSILATWNVWWWDLYNFPETNNKSVWTIKGWFRWCPCLLGAKLSVFDDLYRRVTLDSRVVFCLFVCLFGFVEGWCEYDFLGGFSHIWGAWDN